MKPVLKTAHRIRLKNLRALLSQLDVEPHEVASSWGTSENYLKQVLGEHAGLGLNLASRIEERQKLPDGWLSATHETSEGAPSTKDALEEIKRLAASLPTTELMELASFAIAAARKEPH